MKVVFVGDSASRLNKDKDIAFVGANCYPRLLDWIKQLKVNDYELINSDKNYLLATVYHLYKHGYKVVSLGNKAAKRLDKYNINYFKMDHPSFRNRKLNNPIYINNKLQECEIWLNG